MPRPTYNEVISALTKAQQIAEAKEATDVQYSFYYLNTAVKRILRSARLSNRPVPDWKNGHIDQLEESHTMSHMLED